MNWEIVSINQHHSKRQTIFCAIQLCKCLMIQDKIEIVEFHATVYFKVIESQNGKLINLITCIKCGHFSGISVSENCSPYKVSN